MSILIPNMTIPKDCDECPFRWPHLAHCSITGKSTSHYPTGKEIKGKPNYCPLVDIVRCKECIYYDPPHVEDNGKRIEYKDLPKEAFDELGTGLVNVSYGINVGGRCCVDYNCGYAEDKRVFRAEDNFCSRGEREGE